MTLYEKKSAKQAELLELKEAIEAGDEDAIAKGDEIASALAELEESIAALERAQAALQSVGEEENNEEETPMEDAKSLGEFAVKSFGEMHRGSAINVITPGYKANTDLHTTVDVVQYDRSITDIRPYVPTIRDLLASETISGNALTYYVMGATEAPSGSPIVAEGAKKPQIHVPYEPVTAELQKIPAFLKESDELVEDAPWLKTAIDNRLVTELQNRINTYLFGALGGTSGIGSATWASTDTEIDIADAILTEAMTIEQTTGHRCNGVIVSAGVFAKLRLGKDGENRYYGGGYWGERSAATLWGMPVVVVPGPAAAEFAIVGDFSTASMVTNTSGIQVAMTNANEDDFVYNRVTVRAEQRVALAVRMPSAFTMLTKGQ